jgi:hypothetical protein
MLEAGERIMAAYAPIFAELAKSLSRDRQVRYAGER